jgi:DNA-binding protein YbaB
MFQKARDLYRLQREAKRARKELRNIHIEAEYRGVTVLLSGEQKVLRIDIGAQVPREEIAPCICEAVNRALEKAQLISAEKMKGVMGELGLGSGLGGR